MPLVLPDESSGSTPEVSPRASASLAVLRDGPAGLEVLLLRRADQGDQNSNAWVFPGGLVEAGDRAWPVPPSGPPDLLPGGEGAGDDLAHRIAALRESFEEAGLLWALDAGGAPLGFDADDPLWLGRRNALHRGEPQLDQLCRAQGWRLRPEQLHPVAHWLTPPGMPKRFDTWFYLAALPPGQQARLDGVELVEQRWVTPAAALAAETGLALPNPARCLLEELAPVVDVAAALAWAQRLGPITRTEPRLARNHRGQLGPVNPRHPAWAEIGLIDPAGRGIAHAQIRPGEPVPLGPGLLRITARNGSVMTGPGTNSYLLCSGDPADPASGWALIDPGPDDAVHVQALLAAAPGPIRWILVSHTHIDHSPATQALHAATGAQRLGRLPEHPEWQDDTFQPDRILADGDRLTLGPALTLQVLHTPGHASNHLCFHWLEQALLFTGDHVMQGSTVVINPPDGNMAAYLASLRRLQALAEPRPAGLDAEPAHGPLQWLAPGHGFLIPDPGRALRVLIRHRLNREARVLSALADLGPCSAEALLPRVYDDVPPARHPVALRSLRAHLLHLREQGRVGRVDGAWCSLPAG